MAIKKIILLREDKPNINKVVGDVIEIIDFEKFEGVEVLKVGNSFARVIVNDLDEQLAIDLINGLKRLRRPAIDDPFYQQLLTYGSVTTDNKTILNYVELVNA